MLDFLDTGSEGVLVATEVSMRVNSVQNDDAACLAPADDREAAESSRLL